MSGAKTYMTAVACLVVGGLLYATCRTDIWFVNQLHLDQLVGIDVLHQIVKDSPWYGLVYWLVYCLPDGLWYFALLIIQHRFTRKESLLSRTCFWLAVVLPFFLEGLQAAGLLVGTFDYIDMLTYLFTLILFLCLKKQL